MEASYDEKRYEVDLSYIRVFGTRTEAEGSVSAKEQLTWLEETPTRRDGVEADLEKQLGFNDFEERSEGRITIDLTTCETHIVRDTYYSENEETESEVFDPERRIAMRDKHVANGGGLGYDDRGLEYVREEFKREIAVGNPSARRCEVPGNERQPHVYTTYVVRRPESLGLETEVPKRRKPRCS